MTQAKAYAAASATTPLAPTLIERREPTARDVEIEILYCGICHSDLHQARGEWGRTPYPLVPGHEIVGRVSRVGSDVKKHAVGEIVGVGCLVDSDRSCAHCQAGKEQFCAEQVMTYAGRDKHLGAHTQGGYSERIVVDEHFVLKIPSGLEPAKAAPLLCAGITTFSPMRRGGVKKGTKFGVVGLGGLGHMAVKFGRAFGAHVVVFTTSPSKVNDALRLGADEVVVSTDREQMKKHRGTFDFILDTVSAEHDMGALLGQLKAEGHLSLVGAPSKPLQIPAFSLINGNRSISGSNIGGIRETQEMLDFCGEHGIGSEVEVIGIEQVNEAWERLLKSDVKYRFVIDMASIRS